MKKKLSVLLGGITMVFAGTLTACFVERPTLDLSEFDSVIAYQSEVTLEDLYMIKQKADGTQQRVPITEDMFEVAVDTSSVGEKQAVIAYGGATFTLDYTVKYKVEFAVESEVIDTQFVLSLEEIEIPEVEDKEGYDFISWDDVLPETLTENLYFSAIFEEEVDVPALSEVKAEYGDLLSEIVLPSSEDGAWQFVAAENQTVGAVGSREVEVKFVLNDENHTVHSTSSVLLNVSKKTLQFTNAVTEFEYDGATHTPVYSFDGMDVNDVNLMYIPNYSGDAVNVGSYGFEVIVYDENYQGQWEGSFEITKKHAKISVIGNYEIDLGEELPTVNYTVMDENGEALSQDWITLMGIEVVEPQIKIPGTYELTLSVQNPNFDVTVEKGELKVNKSKLDIKPQITENAKIVYGDTLSGITFVEVPQGVWSWKDANTVISTPNTFTATAVFMPNDSSYYESFEAEVELSVEKREVTISVTQTTFVYNGKAQSLQYTVEGVLAGDENAFSVVGNAEQINAGAYESIILQIESDRYYGASGEFTLTIEQASIADFAYAQSQICEMVWSSNSRLQNVTLPKGYAWKNELTNLSIGNNAYDVEFTPEDTLNYKKEYGQLFVNVVKADAKITATDATFVYNKDNRYDLTASANHKESTLGYAYALKDGTPVEGLSDVGEYVVTITLPESEHYNATSASISVTINAVENADEIPVYSTTYLDTLGKFSLPENEYGKWTWNEGDEAKVGAFGEQIHKATFTPYDTKNYQSRVVEVKFTVAKFAVSVPVVTAKTYTGETLTADIAASDLYEVTENNGGVNVGSYDVAVILLDENYKWSDGAETLARTLTFEITKATNAWTQSPALDKTSWIYGEASAIVTASAKFGEIIITYIDANGNELSTMPTDAGEYKVSFVVEGTANFSGLAAQTREFKITKAAVNCPVIMGKGYTGETLKADVPESDLYEVTENNGGVNVGYYDVVLTLTAPNNYYWNGQESSAATVVDVFEIGKAINEWTETPTLNKDVWTYGEPSAVVTASAKFGEVSVVYVDEKGVESSQMPTSAGYYTVKFSVEETHNYYGLEENTSSFTIEKKTIATPVLEVASVEYDGNPHTPSVTESEYYTVDLSKATDVVNAGEYKVTVTRNNENYSWGIYGFDESTITLTFTIVKAYNSFKVAPELAVGMGMAWTYGDEAPSIYAEPTFGEFVVKFINTTTNEIFAEMPTDVGHYTAQYEVSGTNNYYAYLAQFHFSIKVKRVENPTLEIASVTYDGKAHTAAVEEKEYYTVDLSKATDVIHAGEYPVTVTLISDNYAWIYGDLKAEEELIFTVEAAMDNGWTTTPNVVGWTYGDEPIMPTATAKYGEVKVELGYAGEPFPTHLNAGEYVLRLYVEDTNDYIGYSEYFTFVVERKPIERPVIASVAYDGTQKTAVVAESEYYTVDLMKATNVVDARDYDVYIHLAQNYKWIGEDEYQNVFTFTIEKATDNVWTKAPSMSGWTYDDESVTPTAESKYGSVKIIYVLEDEELWGFPGTLDAGDYAIKFVVEETSNFNGLEEIIPFTVAKKTVSVPTIKAKTYTGETLTSDIGTGNSYYDVIENNGGIECGKYDVILKLKDPANHCWKNPMQGAEDCTVLVFEIVKNANNNWKYGNVPTLSKDSWVYGEDPATVTAAATFGEVQITYVDANGVESAQMPTDTGSYTAKFVVEGTDDYNGLTYEIEFTIKKKAIEIPTLDVASVTYDGTAHTANVEESEYYTVDLSRATGVVNAGNYAVTLTLKNANYKWSDGVETLERTLTFKVEKSTFNAWTNEPSVTNWTYGDAQVNASASAKFGEVKITYVIGGEEMEALPESLNAGAYTVNFTVDETNNYVGMSVSLTLNVAKKAVELPTLDVASAVYDGAKHAASVPANDLYEVTQNNGGVNVDEYDVVLTLTAPNNYYWAGQGVDEETTTLTFEITKATNVWDQAPKLDKTEWTYGEASAIVSAKAKFGGVKTTYIVNGVETTQMPTNAGVYTAKFTVAETTNYSGLTEEIEFTIEKKAIEIPVLEVESETYDTKTHTASVKASAYYTVDLSEATDVINAGEYDVKLTLNSNNYKWSDGDETLERTLTFKVEKAENAWTTTPSVTNWTYGDAQVNASASAKFGEVKITYAINGEEVETLPQNLGAGSYTVNFVVEGTNNYGSLNECLTLNVAKKSVAIPTVTGKTYTGETLTADITASGLYEVTENNGGENVGSYSVTLTLTAPNNYYWNGQSTSESTTKLTFEISQATNEWKQAPALDKTSWIYGETAAVASAETKLGEVQITYVNANGEESAQMPTNAGSYTAKFIVAETANYKGLSAVKSFTIEKLGINAPTLDVESVSYDGKAHTATIAASEYYTVDLSSTTNVVNAGEYEVTVTLSSSNYKWADGVAESARTLTFTIEKATDNAWTTTPTLSKTVWTYGEAAATVSAAAKYGEVAITYTDESGNVYTQMPTKAGTFKAQVALIATDNYNGLATVALEYTINKRVVTVPTLSASSITYDGEMHTPIATSAYYTVGGDTNVARVGSYTLSVSLNEGCVWSDNTTEVKTYAFEIVKAQAVIRDFEISKTDWIYGDDTITVSADCNVGQGAIKFYYDTLANGSFTSTVMPTNVGSYYVKAVVADTENYQGAETEAIGFAIQKATVTLTAPVYDTDVIYYENQVNVATAYKTAPTAIDNWGNVVNGTFTYSIALGQAITSGKVNVSVTFTLSDSANYALSTDSLTASINVKTVAYIDSTNYGSVESALKNAVSGNAIWVTAGLTDAVIAQSCTIPSGVTLNIPHTAGAMNSNGTATLTTTNLSGMSCKTNITLSAGVVLTNKGTLKIAGELSGGTGGGAYAGHTAGAYAKLTLDTNAQIVNTGTINCFGIIAEKTVNNGSKVSVNSGSLYVPFVVRDFRGGSYMYGVYNKRSSLRICPFNQFEFRNVTSLLQVTYGAKIYGYANMYASSKHNATTVELVGTASSALIQLTSGAYFTYKYTPRVYSNATTYTETVGDTTAEGVATFHCYGGATINSMTLSLKVLTTVKISTSDYYFPLTWRFDITLHSGAYTMSNRYKMMAGAKLTVESDATLTVTELSVYNDEDWTDTCKTGGNLYVNRGDALLTVKGTLTATKLAGDVYIQGGTVSATNTSITTYEAIEVSGSSFLASLKSYATISQTYNPITV